MIQVGIRYYDYQKDEATGAEWLTPAVPDTWNISLPSIIRAAMLVGRQSMFDVFQFGEWSKLELRWRSAIVRANTMERPISRRVTRLVPTPAFRALDGSEKGAVSYLLGIAAAKIVAERQCGVRWLMHMDVYTKPDHPYASPFYPVVPVPNADGRPDLIGLDPTGKWAVLEAKGRSGNIPDALKIKSKTQTQTISTINGDMPGWRLASLTSFVKAGMKIDIVDPIEPLPDAFPLTIAPDLFIHLAYRVVFDILNLADAFVLRVRDQPFHVFQMKDIDLTIGLRSDIFDILSRPTRAGDDYHSKTSAIQKAVADLPSEGVEGQMDELTRFSIGPDGTLVGLGRDWPPGGQWPTKGLPLAPFH
ncbi:MAG TPA: hypothetical protein VG722_03215, partial [Tepidisphaeraceae bacterium]|nr:hypothetical protein [Tepidisphaeraceae bacterium]